MDQRLLSSVRQKAKKLLFSGFRADKLSCLYGNLSVKMWQTYWIIPCFQVQFSHAQCLVCKGTTETKCDISCHVEHQPSGLLFLAFGTQPLSPRQLFLALWDTFQWLQSLHLLQTPGKLLFTGLLQGFSFRLLPAQGLRKGFWVFFEDQLKQNQENPSLGLNDVYWYYPAQLSTKIGTMIGGCGMDWYGFATATPGLVMLQQCRSKFGGPWLGAKRPVY